MSLKALALLVPLALGGAYYSGVLGGGSYSRDVDRTPAQVMAALADLDVRREPGSPGTDPSRAGGVRSLFRTERGTNEIAFVVMSGDKVATRMIAHLEPLDGGARTRVTAEVERGDAPDDFVSPAFRSTSLTMSLFSMALEDELNELTLGPRKSQAECQALERNLLEANAPAGVGDRPASLGQAIGGTARTVMVLSAVEAELRRQGCDTRGGGGFMPVSNVMGSGGGGPGGPVAGTSFEPGRPMVDVSRPAGR